MPDGTSRAYGPVVNPVPLENWTASRWNWKRATRRDTRLSDAAKVLAGALCDDFANHETGRCTPKVATLAEALGKSERSVQRALGELRACGWIDVREGRGRGVRSEIVFAAGDGSVTLPAPEKVTALSGYRESRAAEKVTGAAGKGDSRVTPIENQDKNQFRPREAAAERPADPGPRLIVVPDFEGLEARWTAWLAGEGAPPLAEIAERGRASDGRAGFLLPFADPPSGGDGMAERIARRFVAHRLGRGGAARAGQAERRRA